MGLTGKFIALGASEHVTCFDIFSCKNYANGSITGQFPALSRLALLRFGWEYFIYS